jgi:hypothetical protein
VQKAKAQEEASCKAACEEENVAWEEIEIAVSFYNDNEWSPGVGGCLRKGKEGAVQQMRRLVMLAVGVVLVGGVLASSAAASGPTGEYAKYVECPTKTTHIAKCLYSETTSGKIVIGSTEVPLEKLIVLQGGITAVENEVTEEVTETYVPALGGLSKSLTQVAQNVPGGIFGIVPSESLPWWLKAFIKAVTEGPLSSVSATAELTATPTLSESNLTLAEGTALTLPLRVKLGNTFLGSKCFIGSSTHPMTWHLTSGTTDPDTPNTPITGKTGEVKLKEKGRILVLSGDQLVDNAFTVPTVNGCGGLFSGIVDPLVDLKLGLESPDGKNTAVLNNTINQAGAKAVVESE